MAAAEPRPDDGTVEAGDAGAVTECERIEIERLGRQRPAVFASTWTEAGFVLALLTSMMISVSYTADLQSPKTFDRES